MITQALDEKSIDAIRKLSEKAAGRLTPAELTLPDGLGGGLPRKIPVMIRDGETVDIISIKSKIEEWRTAPDRRRGTAKALTLDSFVELVNRHKDEHSVIFGDTAGKTPKLTAVIDYHEKGEAKNPRFGTHRIEYAFPLSDEWKLWTENNGPAKSMGQGEFAAWLEDRISELAAPYDAERSELERLFKCKIGTPSEIIDLSRGLEVCVAARVKNAITLASGEREIVFTEEHLSTAGEKLVVPGLFMISVPPFLDADPLRIPARLRYRNSGGALKWFYEMYRPEFWLRAEIKNALLKAAKETELPAYEGAAESQS